jgi:hypothetical protein
MQGCFTPKVSVLMKFLFIVDIRTYLLIWQLVIRFGKTLNKL